MLSCLAMGMMHSSCPSPLLIKSIPWGHSGLAILSNVAMWIQVANGNVGGHGRADPLWMAWLLLPG